MKIILVSSDVYGLNFPTGGIATFIYHFSELLQTAGYEVCILCSRGEKDPLHPRWWTNYQAKGIQIIQIEDPPPPVHIWGDLWSVRRSEAIASLIDSAEVVYFQEWHANAFHAVRQKHLGLRKMPVCVTVLHGCSEWLRTAMQQYPRVPDDLTLDFAEQYATRYSDFLVSPSRYMLEWVKQHGWILPDKSHVLGLPFLPAPPITLPEPAVLSQLRRLVFFGRMETRKGFELFVEALLLLAQEHPQVEEKIEEVVFLGGESANRFGGSAAAIDLLRAAGFKVVVLNTLTSFEAQTYLRTHRHDTLVVLPSLAENFPYALIETSLIAGLNVICSREGGMPEILGEKGSAQLFAPNRRALAGKIAECFAQPPRSAGALGRYDYAEINRRWLQFHEEVCAYARHLKSSRASLPVKTSPPSENMPAAAVDVCIPYFNQAAYLPQLLTSLEHQTCQDFRVIVVDDGSTDAEARKVFQEMEEKYSARGWRFIRQPNAYLGAARNAAARAGDAPFLCFIDADDIAAPTMVERFLNAIRHSGDDCLACYKILFVHEGLPYDLTTGMMTVAPHQLYKPLGNSLTAGLVMNVFGGAGMIIRRTVFEILGGYTEESGFTGEDYEFFAKLALSEYRMDVVPEYLYFYRVVEGSMLRTTERYLNTQRVLRVYTDHLQKSGLGALATAFHGLHQHAQSLENKVNTLKTQLALPTIAQDSPNHPLQDLEGKLWPLEHKLETQLWQVEHKIDLQTALMQQPPSPYRFLQGLYHFVVPLALRLRLRSWRRRLARK